MGIKGSSTRSVFLDNAEVPVENLLGEIGRGHIIAFNILNIGRYKLGLGAWAEPKSHGNHHSVHQSAQTVQPRHFLFQSDKEKLATMAARLYAAKAPFTGRSDCLKNG